MYLQIHVKKQKPSGSLYGNSGTTQAATAAIMCAAGAFAAAEDVCPVLLRGRRREEQASMYVLARTMRVSFTPFCSRLFLTKSQP